MSKNEDIENIKLIIPIIICALLTGAWFHMNDSNNLPLIGHTSLVFGWINENASKMKLLIDLIYFSISTAAIIVITDMVFSQLISEMKLLIKFDRDSCFTASVAVNILVFLYEFHVLEFRIKLIGLSIALIIFYAIGFGIAMKVLETFRPISEIVEKLNEINENDDKK